MNTDIIPIRFFGGTGGHFLDAWITESKFRQLNLPYDVSKFSDVGNAHSFEKEYSCVIHNYSIASPIDEHLNAILEATPNTNYSKKPPYTLLTHFRDPGVLEQYFKKTINICYELDDITEIARVYVNKNNPSQHINERVKFAMTLSEKFSPIQNSANFSVSWKELLYGDDIVLIEKIENYIGMQGLDPAFLHNWRKLTSLSK